VTAASGNDGISTDELALATRNHGMPLEFLRHDVTPVGAHYVLTHYDVPAVDTDTWRLHVSGAVDTPLSLSLDDIRVRPRLSRTVTMECAGNGRAFLSPRPLSQPWLHEAVGTARWSGCSLADLLAEVGVGHGAVDVVFEGADRGIEGGQAQTYARGLSLDEAARAEVVLADEMNGLPLPPQHGAPLRLVVPGWYGMTSVKWLRSITVTTEPYTGYQNTRSYRWRTRDDDPGTPMSVMRPRALMAPPGIPGFLPRSRFLRPGPVLLEGRAWSGRQSITDVQVRTDDEGPWRRAELEPPDDPYAWWRWTFKWEATPGDHVLSCRATDDRGVVQPLEPEWNVGGYGNHAVQRVAVRVDGA